MIERDHGGDIVFVARRENAAIVFESGHGEVASLRFDARPFDGESVGIQAELCQ